MLDLTIVIPVKNEADSLFDCLDSIGHGFAKRVVVVDSKSTDQTPQIAEDWGAEVVQFDWNGRFPKKRNWFLREHTPDTTWVMFLDADEHLTAAFKRELEQTLPNNTHVGFWLHYTIYFLGRELRHGYPLDKLALFRVGAGEYEHIDEQAWSALDMEIHEHPVLEGTIGTIKSKIDHRDFREISHWIRKHNEYSSWEAKRYLEQQSSGERASRTLRQKIKYRLLSSPFAGPVYFLGAFVLMRGFLDGRLGFVFALMKMNYFTQIYVKIQEIEGQDQAR